MDSSHPDYAYWAKKARTLRQRPLYEVIIGPGESTYEIFYASRPQLHRLSVVFPAEWYHYFNTGYLAIKLHGVKKYYRPSTKPPKIMAFYNPKLCHEVTEQLVKKMEQGVVPWRQSWGGGFVLPYNFTSKHDYQGLNLLTLAICGGGGGFATLKQIKDMGGKLREGVDVRRDGITVTFFKMWEKPDTGEEVPFVRMSRVFSAKMVEGIDLSGKLREEPDVPLNSDFLNEKAEGILKRIQPKPVIQYGKPSYVPALDVVRMPDFFEFHSADAYYSTLFHELGHWTGHENRLSRAGITSKEARKGSALYAKEELVAELTAAFMSAHCGIDQEGIQQEQSAAYLDYWIQVLRAEPSLILEASALANKATKYLLSRSAELVATTSRPMKAAA